MGLVEIGYPTNPHRRMRNAFSVRGIIFCREKTRIGSMAAALYWPKKVKGAGLLDLGVLPNIPS